MCGFQNPTSHTLHGSDGTVHWVQEAYSVTHHLAQTAHSHKVDNKKSELMLMRRATAYDSSCSQVILVYLQIPHLFRRN